jgi:mannose-6-phosphate isomerase
MLRLASALMTCPDASSPRPMDFRLDDMAMHLPLGVKSVLVCPWQGASIIYETASCPFSRRSPFSLHSKFGRHSARPYNGSQAGDPLAGAGHGSPIHRKEAVMTMEPYPLCFSPVFKERIWGGQKLREWFPDCPEGKPIGEAWVLSDHPEGPTPVANGPYEGKFLHELMRLEPAWFEGIQEERFPLLIKVIDAADDLSIQVHPDDSYGYAHAGERGKTECWWVLRTEPGARIVYGHTAQTREEFEARVKQGEWSALLRSVPVQTGDFIFVPAGKLHALGRGVMVLEIQQSSDTTYRVYDYDRVDASGKPRPLHLADALNVIRYPDIEVPDERRPIEDPPGEQLVMCPYFAVQRWDIEGRRAFSNRPLMILSVAAGRGTLHHESGVLGLEPGRQVLIPSGMSEWRLQGTMTVIATTLP